jgi:hypothetical protein
MALPQSVSDHREERIVLPRGPRSLVHILFGAVGSGCTTTIVLLMGAMALEGERVHPEAVAATVLLLVLFVSALLWSSIGTEEVRVSQSYVSIIYRAGPLRVRQVFRLAGMTRLRSVDNPLAGEPAPPFGILGIGAIAFHYESGERRFGAALDRAEGNRYVERIVGAATRLGADARALTGDSNTPRVTRNLHRDRATEFILPSRKLSVERVLQCWLMVIGVGILLHGLTPLRVTFPCFLSCAGDLIAAVLGLSLFIAAFWEIAFRWAPTQRVVVGEGQLQLKRQLGPFSWCVRYELTEVHGVRAVPPLPSRQGTGAAEEKHAWRLGFTYRERFIEWGEGVDERLARDLVDELTRASIAGHPYEGDGRPESGNA